MTAVRLRVLLVEDNVDMADLLAMALERRGHAVTTATNGGDALRLTAEQAFDLVISDLGLPDLSGQDLIRQIHAATGALPAIALSGYGRPEDVEASIAAGFHCHLTKPIDIAQLEAVMSQITLRS